MVIWLQIRKNENTVVENNTFSGKVNYGMQISGSKSRQGIDLASRDNHIQQNDMDQLQIKKPDDYSNGNVNGYAFTGENGISKLAHIWLNPYSCNNTINIDSDHVIIDEGSENQK